MLLPESELTRHSDLFPSDSVVPQPLQMGGEVADLAVCFGSLIK